MQQIRLILFFLLPLLLTAQINTAQAQTDDNRGATLLTQRFLETQPFDRWQSQGVFVGISEFSRNGQLANIPYAADDAVDLAHLFSLELGLIPPRQVRLLLSGKPQKSNSKNQLAALKSKGAQISSASTADILSAIDTAAKSAGPRGFLIVSLATHGFTNQDQHYLMTDGSLLNFVEQTGLSTDKIIEVINQAKSTRSLVLIDACRSQLRRDRSPSGAPDEESRLSQAFLRALSKAEGQVVMVAAREGEYAYDDPDQGNGVFSGAVLAGLRCGASANRDGLITVQSLYRYVNREVTSWQMRSGRARAKPGIQYDVGGEAARLPLAFCGSGKDEEPPTIWPDVQVILKTSSQRAERTREFPVDYEKNDHPVVFANHSRSYRADFQADPGFLIQRAEFSQRSAHEVHDFQLFVAEDQKSATMTFRLKSGAMVNRFRGWLRGKVVLTQEQVIPSHKVTLPITLDFTRFGRYEVDASESINASQIQDVTVQDRNGALLAHGNFGETMLSSNDRFELKLLSDEGKLFLELYSHIAESDPGAEVANPNPQTLPSQGDSGR